MPSNNEEFDFLDDFAARWLIARGKMIEVKPGMCFESFREVEIANKSAETIYAYIYPQEEEKPNE